MYMLLLPAVVLQQVSARGVSYIRKRDKTFNFFHLLRRPIIVNRTYGTQKPVYFAVFTKKYSALFTIYHGPPRNSTAVGLF